MLKKSNKSPKSKGIASILTLLLLLAVTIAYGTSFTNLVSNFTPNVNEDLRSLISYSTSTHTLTITNPTSETVNLKSLKLILVNETATRVINIHDENNNNLWEPREKIRMHIPPSNTPTKILVYYDNILLTSLTIVPNAQPPSQDKEYPDITIKKVGPTTYEVSVSDDSGISSVEISAHDADLIVNGQTTSNPYTEYFSGEKEWSSTIVLKPRDPGIAYAILRVTDITGKVSQKVLGNVTIKDLPPHVKIVSPQDNSEYWTTKNSYNLPITIHVWDDVLVKLIKVILDGTAIATKPINAKDKTITVTVPLNVGPHEIQVKAQDNRLNIGLSNILNVLIRKDNPPSVTFTEPKEDKFYTPSGKTYSLEVVVSANDDRQVAQIDLYLNNTLIYSTKNTTTLHHTLSLNPGTYILKAVATDNAKQTNVTTKKIEVISDNPPSVTIHEPKEKTYYVKWNATKVQVPIKFEIDDDRPPLNLTLQIANGTTTVFYKESSNLPAGSYSMTATIPPGDYTLTIKVTDQLDQVTTATVHFIIKNDNPPYGSFIASS